MNTQNLTPQVFHFHQHPVRTMLIERQPWFIAKDLCGVLGVTEQKKAVRHLDEDERKVIPVLVTDEAKENNTPLSSGARTQRRNVTIVSESGMYALVMRSRKPEAKQFRKWVTHDVLPTIRSTDGYKAAPGHNPLEFLHGIFGQAPAHAKEVTRPVGNPVTGAAAKPKALPGALPAGVLDARAVPTTMVGLLSGKVRMVSVEGVQWYSLLDVVNIIGAARHSSEQCARTLPHAHRRKVRLYGSAASGWFVNDTGLRLVLGAKGLLHSQLTINLD